MRHFQITYHLRHAVCWSPGKPVRRHAGKAPRKERTAILTPRPECVSPLLPLVPTRIYTVLHNRPGCLGGTGASTDIGTGPRRVVHPGAKGKPDDRHLWRPVGSTWLYSHEHEMGYVLRVSSVVSLCVLLLRLLSSNLLPPLPSLSS